jgi:hypothetical protein
MPMGSPFRFHDMMDQAVKDAAVLAAELENAALHSILEEHYDTVNKARCDAVDVVRALGGARFLGKSAMMTAERLETALSSLGAMHAVFDVLMNSENPVRTKAQGWKELVEQVRSTIVDAVERSPNALAV